MEKVNWFESWFDTHYYHILYKNRDNKEAEKFIGNLVDRMNIPPSSNVLDLACGKGRHSVTLFTHGYKVLGADLSESSIEQASFMANNDLDFMVHDMRKFIPGKQKAFKAIFNLFTSFGYFDSMEDNLRVLLAVHEMLEDDGLLLIDFMNAHKVVANLVQQEIKVEEGITFNIERKYDGSHIYKYIQFEDEGKAFNFMERVQALTLNDFTKMLTACGFEIQDVYGNFDLDAFDANSSDRLIILAQKK